jgi:hypothetical protein
MLGLERIAAAAALIPAAVRSEDWLLALAASLDLEAGVKDCLIGDDYFGWMVDKQGTRVGQADIVAAAARLEAAMEALGVAWEQNRKRWDDIVAMAEEADQ